MRFPTPLLNLTMMRRLPVTTPTDLSAPPVAITRVFSSLAARGGRNCVATPRLGDDAHTVKGSMALTKGPVCKLYRLGRAKISVPSAINLYTLSTAAG